MTESVLNKPVRTMFAHHFEMQGAIFWTHKLPFREPTYTMLDFVSNMQHPSVIADTDIRQRIQND